MLTHTQFDPPVLPIPDPPEAWKHPHDVHCWVLLQISRHVAAYLRLYPGEAYEIARNVIFESAKGQQPWPDHREWLKLMENKSVEEVAQLLEEDSQNAERLRASSPFIGRVFCSREQVAAIKKKAFSVTKTLWSGSRI
jgi:hypothetical protein